MIDRAKLSSYLGDPSLMLAIPATGIYYAIVLQPAMRESVLYRYTGVHAVEYVIVAMFLWGMIDVFLKSCSFPRELWALRRPWLPQRTGRVPAQQAEVLLDQVRAQPPRALHSRMGQRLVQALSYVVENKSAEELPEHLRYLAEQDDDRTYNRYSLARFVVAVTPILGFLGTVVHFGTALSGLSMTNLESELSHVVSEMGTAFNTTTIALGAAMFTMFALFLCERAEHGMISRINRFTERELQNRFEVKDANLVPFLAILEGANKEFHAAVEQSLQQQVAAWSTALRALFEQFDQRQKHDEQRWQALCVELQDRHLTYDAARDERLKQMLSLADARQEQHLAQIHQALEQASQFSTEVGALAKTLNNIARGEGRLAELQATLTENLRVLHETKQIDAALHGLTAAIHLLTVRNPSHPFSNAA